MESAAAAAATRRAVWAELRKGTPKLPPTLEDALRLRVGMPQRVLAFCLLHEQEHYLRQNMPLAALTPGQFVGDVISRAHEHLARHGSLIRGAPLMLRPVSEDEWALLSFGWFVEAANAGRATARDYIESIGS